MEETPTKSKLMKMKNDELKDLLAERGVETTGTKVRSFVFFVTTSEMYFFIIP
jgi:hypothetical protein